MNHRQAPYYKALVLLTVFSLNTVVSFACSLGGVFHNLHHSNAATGAFHQPQEHHGDGGHKHDHGTNGHHSATDAEKPTKDDCCSNNVIEIEKLEKSVSRAIEAPGIIFLTSLITSYTSLFQLFPVQEQTVYPDPVRWRFPATIQNLRIVIQSFQI